MIVKIENELHYVQIFFCLVKFLNLFLNLNENTKFVYILVQINEDENLILGVLLTKFFFIFFTFYKKKSCLNPLLTNNKNKKMGFIITNIFLKRKIY